MWPTYSLFAILIVIGLGLPIYAWINAPDWLPVLIPLSLLAVMCVVISAVFLSKDRGYAAIVTVVLFAAGVVAYGSDAVVGKVNDVKSARSFCLKIQDRIPPGEKLKMFRFYRPVYAYYTRRLVEHTRDPAALQEWFSSQERAYIVTKDNVYLKIKETFPLPIHVIHRQFIDHRYVFLLSNRPDDRSPEPAGSVHK